MFDIGFAELFLLSLIGLLVLGPERLPAVARTLGGFVRKARVSYYNLKRTVEAELAAAEAANPIKEAQKELESVQQQVRELGQKLDENQVPALEPTPATARDDSAVEPTTPGADAPTESTDEAPTRDSGDAGASPQAEAPDRDAGPESSDEKRDPETP
jgi:sec-independent protein translocase protein TatB